MAVCKHCGNGVLWLHDAHKECARRHDPGREEIKSKVISAVLLDKEYSEIEQSVTIIAKTSFISTHNVRKSILSGWSEAAERLTDDHEIDYVLHGRLRKFVASGWLLKYLLAGSISPLSGWPTVRTEFVMT